MLLSIRSWALSIGLVAALLSSPGCNQQRKVTVTGSVLRNGQPIPVSATGYVQVTLMPDVGSQEYTTRQARCEKDGSFKIVEVPPGRYKIGVEQWDPNPQID
ncbi:MAG TPA: carboxypeptidase-like regulatory domain-containing protein, partial [Pirellulaceae bacterium]|nr:carboxypeptidase-like regulatory domain-containing protein [Pirellulaceae bacterium]